MGSTSGQIEEVSHFGHGDVLGLGRMIWNGTNSQRESRFLVQEEGMANNVKRCGNRAEVGVVGVVKERDLFTILFVLLCLPANVDGGYVVQLHVGDVVDGDVSSRKNSKSSTMKASGGCEGQFVMHL